MEASSIACNEDPNKSRRATRKAAAACLARQRHKSFVNGLQDQGSVLRGRIESLRRRRGHAESAAAAYMMHRFGAVLGADQFGQLKGWLRRCALNGLNAPQPPLDIYFTRHFRGFLSRPQLGARNADAAAPSSSTAAR